MNDTWDFGLSFSAFHLLFGLGIVWVWALSLLPSPCPFLSRVHGLASAFAMPLHCTAPAMISLIILSCCCLWAYKLKLLPAYFLHYFFFWALLASILARPAHFIPRASSTHFLLPYLFYSHEFLLNPLGFPGPITTFLPFGLIGLYANLMNLLIPFLGFLDPFYLFSISYNSHGFTTSFLRLPWPICFLPGHLLFLWA